MNLLKQKYDEVCKTPSDINEHLPILSLYASECDHITEMGVRNVVSSWAFVNGLKNNFKEKSKKLVGVDLNFSKNILILKEECKKNRIEYEFIKDNSIKIEIEYTDLLFIDTWHVYGQLKRELNKHYKKVRKYIILHDTTVDAIDGESIRLNLNIKKQSLKTGYPEEEINKGLKPAIDEFLIEHNEWKIKEEFKNNSGLTILERVN